ncbi:unnamed protein product [Closterium sp. NIES-54]
MDRKLHTHQDWKHETQEQLQLSHTDVSTGRVRQGPSVGVAIGAAAEPTTVAATATGAAAAAIAAAAATTAVAAVVATTIRGGGGVTLAGAKFAAGAFGAVVNGWVGFRAVGNGVGRSVRSDAVGSDEGQFSAVGSSEERSRAAGEKMGGLSMGVMRARAAAVDATAGDALLKGTRKRGEYERTGAHGWVGAYGRVATDGCIREARFGRTGGCIRANVEERARTNGRVRTGGWVHMGECVRADVSSWQVRTGGCERAGVYQQGRLREAAGPSKESRRA